MAVIPDHLFEKLKSEVPCVVADGSQSRHRNQMAPGRGKGCSHTGNALILCHQQRERRKQNQPASQAARLAPTKAEPRVKSIITEQAGDCFPRGADAANVRSDLSALGSSTDSLSFLWKIEKGDGLVPSRRELQGDAPRPTPRRSWPCFRDPMPSTGWVWLGKGQSCDCPREAVKTP